jgi:hypothetical protein
MKKINLITLKVKVSPIGSFLWLRTKSWSGLKISKIFSTTILKQLS